MSDAYSPFPVEEPVPPPIDLPGPQAQQEAPGLDGQPAEELQEEAPRSYLELDDDVSNRYVRVKVDGEDIEVPLREALNGYSRQADYTRKTMELAQQRQQVEFASSLQRALQAEPEETLRLLARRLGVSFDQPQAPQQQPAVERNPYLDDYDEFGTQVDDPVAQRIALLEDRIRQSDTRWEQEQADRTLRAAISGLQQKFSVDDATTREVVGRALQRRQGPEYFESIYKEIAFDRAHQARQQAAANQAAETQRRQAAAANASATVASGGSSLGVGSAQQVDPAERNMTIEEAFALAESQHGSPFRR